jgi:hypothetical protein
MRQEYEMDLATREGLITFLHGLVGKTVKTARVTADNQLHLTATGGSSDLEIWITLPPQKAPTQP